MWIEKRNNYYRMYERYTDPVSRKVHKVSVRLDKLTPQQRNKAQTQLDKIIAERKQFKVDVPFRVLCNVYLMQKEKEVKPSTHRRNTHECDTLVKILGNVSVDALTAGYVKTRLMNYNPKPSTVNEHIQRFKEIMKWGYQNDYIGDISFIDKITKLKAISKHQKVKDKFLEKDECDLLLADMGKMQRNLTKFMLLSGLRVGECLALEKADLDIKNRLISVTKSKDAITGEITTPKTLASIRQVDIQDDFLPLCEEILDQADKVRKNVDVDCLFWNKNGEPMEYAAFNNYLKKHSRAVLGRPISTHVLRHTHASLLAENGMRYDLIQRRLGHENSQITKDIYIHTTSGTKEKDREQVKGVHLI